MPNQPQPVMVKTKVGTGTKVAIGVTSIFLAGLAAYGFGFVPANFNNANSDPQQQQPQDQQQPTDQGNQGQAGPAGSCEDKCGVAYKSCSTQDTTGLCDINFQGCIRACNPNVQQDQPGAAPTTGSSTLDIPVATGTPATTSTANQDINPSIDTSTPPIVGGAALPTASTSTQTAASSTLDATAPTTDTTTY